MSANYTIYILRNEFILIEWRSPFYQCSIDNFNRLMLYLLDILKARETWQRFIHGSSTSWCGNQMWKLAKTISLQSKCNQMCYFYVWTVMLMLMPSCLLGESLTCHFSCSTELSFVHSMRLVWKSNEFPKNITTLFYSTCTHMLGKRLLQPYRLLIIIRMFFSTFLNCNILYKIYNAHEKWLNKEIR